MADSTAVKGDAMLIGPIASAAKSALMATDDMAPASTPQNSAAGVKLSPSHGLRVSNSTKPARAEKQVTVIARIFRAAIAPKKSEKP
jgi:hypothetical protein